MQNQESQPGLRRIDDQPIIMEREPEAFQKIGITVESVCYYEDTGVTSRPLSAVLLSVFFNLLRGENLTSASIPLVVVGKSSNPVQSDLSAEAGEPSSVAASPSSGDPATANLEPWLLVSRSQVPQSFQNPRAPGSLTEITGSYSYSRDNPSVEIFGSYPSSDEYVRVPNRTNAREGFSAESRGDRGTKVQEMLIISLSPQRRKLDGPTTLSWVFQGQKGALYPSNIRLLVIVCGPAAGEQERDSNGRIRPFTFRLCLQQKNLHIGGHKTRVDRTRFGFMRRFYLSNFYSEDDDVPKHDGWYFDIDRPYKSKIAEAALEGAKNGQEVGLIAALSSALTEVRQ